MKDSINTQIEDLDLDGLHEDFKHKYKFCEHLHEFPVFEQFKGRFEAINNSVEEFVKAQEENCDLDEARKFFEHQCNLLKSTIAECTLIHRFQNPRTRISKDRPTVR